MDVLQETEMMVCSVEAQEVKLTSWLLLKLDLPTPPTWVKAVTTRQATSPCLLRHVIMRHVCAGKAFSIVRQQQHCARLVVRSQNALTRSQNSFSTSLIPLLIPVSPLAAI